MNLSAKERLDKYVKESEEYRKEKFKPKNALEEKIHKIDNKSSYSTELKKNIKSKKEEINGINFTIKKINDYLLQLKKDIEICDKDINQFEEELKIIQKYLEFRTVLQNKYADRIYN